MSTKTLSDKEHIRHAFQRQGFLDVKITTPWTKGLHERLKVFLQTNYHGDMTWLQRDPHKRSSPRYRHQSIRTVLMATMAYTPPEPQPPEAHKHGIIAAYGLHRDYHKVITSKMATLATWFHRHFHHRAFPFVDTSAMMEKPLAQAAGLGWQGKHTNLVARKGGSWVFLAGMVTSKILPLDQREQDHCGSCRACLDVCPTKAFPRPYVLDAKRCISYLTIEHKGVIHPSLRRGMGNRLFGCDDCLMVCPWNKFAQRAKSLPYREDLKAQPLTRWLTMTPHHFRELFANTSIVRTGYERFMRNVLIVVGNSRSHSLEGFLDGYLEHPSPLIRGMAVWALGRIASPVTLERARQRYQRGEKEQDVQAEWQALPKA